MEKFGTFIITSAGQTDDVVNLQASTEWRLSVRNDPSQRHWSDQYGRTSTILYGAVDSERLEWLRRGAQDYVPSQQIVIEATDFGTASNVNSLIHGGILLGCPDLLLSPEPSDVYPLSEVPEKAYSSEIFAPRFQSYEHVALGCQVAKRAWEEQPLIYAIEKYKRNLKLDWFTPHSAAPSYGQMFSNNYVDHAYHVTAAFAIVAAFSVIEELDLEVRSSSEKSRFIGAAKDEWNPKVKKDLESRLVRRGVDFEAPYYWVRRGQPTAIEKGMKPRLGNLAPYTRSEEVRDYEIALIDAIHQASWLRNYITAHRFSDLNKAISPYDVFNVQSVARRLILSCLGLWRESWSSKER